MKFILINGPKRTGKTSAAKMVAHEYTEVEIIGFSYHLKRFCHGIYLGREGFEMDPDIFDDCKEVPQTILSGMSWRQVYIHYSEQVIKPLHGEEWFGDKLLETAIKSGKELIVVPDSGFRREAERLVRAVGPDNVVLLRKHRPNHGFEGDSRNYVDLSDLGVLCLDLHSPEGGAWHYLLLEDLKNVVRILYPEALSPVLKVLD